MENTTNNSFEEQWQKAFDDASLPPSEAVWERIESGLQSNIPPKPNHNSYYYFGIISAVILGVSVWFYMNRNEEEKQVQVIENKDIGLESKVEKIVSKKEEKRMVYSKEKITSKKIFIPQKEEFIEPEIVMTEPENQQRLISDSVDFMSPIMETKKMNSEFLNPTISIPFEQTPYYEILKPKPKKKSIWDKVRISGGVGVY